MALSWENILKSLKEGALYSAEKIEKYSKIAKVKVDIITVKRKIAAQFAEMGGVVYNLFQENKSEKIANHEAIKKIIKTIEGLEKELQTKEKYEKSLNASEDMIDESSEKK